MRIVQLVGNYPPTICGVGSYTQKLSEHLAAAGAEVHIITSTHNAPVQPSERVHILPVMPAWNASDLPLLRQQLDRINPDIIQIQYQITPFNQGTLVYRLPLAVKKPVITTFHDYTGPKWMGKAHPLPVIGQILSNKRFVVTHEKPQKAFARVPLIRDKMVKIPVGSNIDRVNKPGVAAPLPFEKRDPIITFFGFIWRGKNIENLIQAQRSLLNDGLPTQLLVIGDIVEKDYHAELLALARELNIAERVHFTGACDDETISLMLQAADVCVLPFSKGVTSGHGTILTAIQHELPVVTTTPASGAADYFIHRHNIMLVPIGDQEQLEAAVKEVLQSADLREKIKTNVKDLAARFDWTTIAQLHLDMYRDVAG